MAVPVLRQQMHALYSPPRLCGEGGGPRSPFPQTCDSSGL